MTESRLSLMVKLLLLAIPLITGCGPSLPQLFVQVSDEAGHPIEGATVSVVPPSSGSRDSLTNAAGIAPVSVTTAFGDAWVSVGAGGFESEKVHPPDVWPLKVRLRRARTDYEAVVVLLRQGPLTEPALDVGDLDPRFLLEFELRRVVRGTPPAILRYGVHSPALFLNGLDGELRLISEDVEFRGRKLRRVRVARAELER